jgi:glycosyltransferase involved in cell wall biosynthesis
MSKLRILHTEASSGWGGQEIRILDEAAGLIARGHDVQLAAPAGAMIVEEAEKRGIPIHRLSIDRRRIRSLRALSRLIETIAPQVIVTHSSTDSWLVSVATTMMRAASTVVRMRHVSTPVRPGALNRWLYGRVPARVISTGESLRRELIASLGLDPAHVVSIPTGVDLDRFRHGDQTVARQKLGLANGTMVGIVATLRSWKGHRFLLAAMTDPALANARLVIVGDGPQTEALQKEVTKLGLGGRVTFAGRQDDVVPWMRALDVFALPSTSNEGVPQALMQAMACAVPVVTTSVGAIPELVSDGKTGLIVRPESANALAAALARILGDRDLASRLSEAGRRHVEENYTARAMLDEMEGVLTEVAKFDQVNTRKQPAP